MTRIGLVVAGLLLTATEAVGCEPPDRGVVVSPAGRDDGAGTAEQPFRSLARAQAQLRAVPDLRTIWIDGGVYALEAPLVLDGRDDRTRLRACPGQGPAVDGGKAGLDTLLVLRGADGVVVAGLTFAHAAGPALAVEGGRGVRIEGNLFSDTGTAILLTGGSGHVVCSNRVLHAQASGIEAKDGVTHLLIARNDIDGTGAPSTHGGGIFVHGSEDVAIARNRVRATRGMGIGVANWDRATSNHGFNIVGNVVQATNRDAEDSGAIYVLGRSHIDLEARIAGNLVEDAGLPGDAHTIAVYLDDSASGVVVEGNTLRAPFTHAVQIHGGDDILVRDNVIDLDPAATSAVLFQAAPADTNPLNTMRNNRVRRNLIRMRGTARPTTTSLEGGAPAVAGNLVIRALDGRLGDDSGNDLILAERSHLDLRAWLEVARPLIGLHATEAPALGRNPAGECNPKDYGIKPE